MHPFLINPKSKISDFIYCYKSAKSSLRTLSTMKLRFSPLNALNDPLEQTLNTFFISDDQAVENKEELRSLLKDQIAICNSDLKVLCFTQDKRFSLDTIASSANRGFMRFRMWAQYADNGTGACFIFDKSKFELAFAEMRKKVPFSGSGAVSYTDNYQERLTAHDYKISELLKMHNGSDIMLEKVKQNYPHYILTKRTDWQEENEYRYFVMNKEDIYIDISSSLVGICLGYNPDKTLEDTVFKNKSLKKARIILQGFHALLKGID